MVIRYIKCLVNLLSLVSSQYSLISNLVLYCFLFRDLLRLNYLISIKLDLNLISSPFTQNYTLRLFLRFSYKAWFLYFNISKLLLISLLCLIFACTCSCFFHFIKLLYSGWTNLTFKCFNLTCLFQFKACQS
jgi:hypothetical protein